MRIPFSLETRRSSREGGGGCTPNTLPLDSTYILFESFSLIQKYPTVSVWKEVSFNMDIMAFTYWSIMQLSTFVMDFCWVVLIVWRHRCWKFSFHPTTTANRGFARHVFQVYSQTPKVSVLSRLKLRENVRAFFSQGQSKLSVIKRCPN